MTILVTGGASGLGKEITKKLACNKNNTVIFTYNNSKQEASDIASSFTNSIPIKCDFNIEENIEQLLSQIQHYNIDILINNAFSGNIEKQYFHKNTKEIFLNGFVNNVLPTLRITQQAILVFRKKKFGKIITILSSAIVNKAPIGWSEYVASKNYLHSMIKSWAVENVAFNITSNAISPSFMQTALTSDTDERVIEEMISKHPLKKLLLPVEVAHSVEYLTNCPQQINGINLVINAASDVI